jgi:cytochrome c-type biogenesis protein CcsB
MILTGYRAVFSSASNTAFVLAVSVYLVAVACYFAGIAWQSRRLRKVATVIAALGAASHLVALACRAVAAGRAPWGNMYEFSMSSSFVMVVAYLAFATRFKSPQIGGFVLSAVAIWMGVGWVLYADPGPLQPALRSNWLVFHVFLVMTGAGILLLSSVVSCLYLVRYRWEVRQGVAQDGSVSLDEEIPEHVVESGSNDALDDSEPELISASAGADTRPEGPGAMTAVQTITKRGGLVSRLPSSQSLDRFAYRLVMVAFPIWTLGVIAGAIWGEQAWGRYWGWDPKEVWSFIVWVIFATYLHARATRGWRGTGAAVLAIVGGAAIIFNTFAVNLWISGLHSYAGV